MGHVSTGKDKYEVPLRDVLQCFVLSGTHLALERASYHLLAHCKKAFEGGRATRDLGEIPVMLVSLGHKCKVFAKIDLRRVASLADVLNAPVVPDVPSTPAVTTLQTLVGSEHAVRAQAALYELYLVLEPVLLLEWGLDLTHVMNACSKALMPLKANSKQCTTILLNAKEAAGGWSKLTNVHVEGACAACE
jgi:hypothetical protein